MSFIRILWLFNRNPTCVNDKVCRDLAYMVKDALNIVINKLIGDGLLDNLLPMAKPIFIGLFSQLPQWVLNQLLKMPAKEVLPILEKVAPLGAVGLAGAIICLINNLAPKKQVPVSNVAEDELQKTPNTFTPAKDKAATMRGEEEKELKDALEAFSARVGLTPAA